MDEGEATPARMADPSVVCYRPIWSAGQSVPEVTKEEVMLVAMEQWRRNNRGPKSQSRKMEQNHSAMDGMDQLL